MPRIILKSNDSLNYFPANKPSDFTVKTVNLASIGDNLEVALNEIIFPFGVMNVRDGYNQIDAILAMGESKELTVDEITDSPRTEFKINPNYYNPSSLINEINVKIKEWMYQNAFREYTRYGYTFSYNKIRIKFGMDIAKILGYNMGEWLTLDYEVGKDILINNSDPLGAYKNMPLLNIYCNLVEESLIGENHHQLLRIVKWNFADINGFIFNPSIVYDRPYFIPVKHANANSIEIKITDSLNIPIEFIGDKPIVIILEFRKIMVS